MVLWLGFYILNENETDEHKVKGYHKVYTPLKVIRLTIYCTTAHWQLQM